MADIFISYKREDEEQKGRVLPFVQALTAEGYDVFYDVEVPPGETWESVLQAKINAAKCVIVLWSEASVASDWVKEEAEIAKLAGKIIPVFLDPVSAPFGFGRIEGANLVGWTGDLDHVEWKNLVRAIKSRVGSPEHERDTSVTRVPMPVEAPVRKQKNAGGLIALVLALIVVGGAGYFGFQYFQGQETGRRATGSIAEEVSELRENQRDEEIAAEENLYRRVMASEDVHALEAFLERYPNTLYRDRVEARIEELMNAEDADPDEEDNPSTGERPVLINPDIVSRIPSGQIRPIIREDCIDLSGDYQVVRMSGDSGFQLTDRRRGNALLSASGSSAANEMNRALDILAGYDADRQCFVGRPDAELTYYTRNGDLLSGAMPGEDCLSVDISSLSVRQRGGMYLLMSSNSSMISFDNEADANAALSVLRRYEASEICYVGRPGPSMMYLKK